MDHRLLLDKLAADFSTIQLNGHTYPITNGCFATVDPADPYRLLEEEQEVIDSLVESFTHSEKLHRHMDF